MMGVVRYFLGNRWFGIFWNSNAEPVGFAKAESEDGEELDLTAFDDGSFGGIMKDGTSLAGGVYFDDPEDE